MSISANQWNVLEPSVIRDAVNGRLGFQDKFGTTYVSGATEALALKQNPIDGSPNEGDAYLYVGTTNGGVYMRHYDYQTDTWSEDWTWQSKPSGSGTEGYEGAQGIGALELSPDGRFIAVGRGGSSNYNAYTPAGPAVQVGKILADGSIDWLPVQNIGATSGASGGSNVRGLTWQDDGLYASFAPGNEATAGTPAQLVRLAVDDEGLFTGLNVFASANGNVISTDASAPDAPVFFSPLTGALSLVEPTSDSFVTLSGQPWDAIRQERVDNGELLARISVADDPNVAGQQVVLIGWVLYQAPNYSPNYITHVDRLTVDANRAIKAVESIDFSGKAGGNQALPLPFYGNYSLTFDPNDASLNTVLVGGNQYLDNHPDGATPYSPTGGLVRGNFDTQVIEAVFGPYRATDDKLVEQSLLIGAPHADSRAVAALQTAAGVALIQSDDGGVWLLSASPSDPATLGWTSLNAPGLNALETLAMGWDARSNSFVSSFQDNASSIGQLGDAFMHNVWAGDGVFGLMDGAAVTDASATSWAYLNSQRYMGNGTVNAFGLDAQGDVISAEILTMVTNWQGQSVQPIELVELFAVNNANPDTPPENLSDLSLFSGPASVNPYRQGDVVLAGDSGLYETFLPNGSDLATADGFGTLQLLPVTPFSDANTVFTAIDIGSSAAFVNANAAAKPFYWDSLLAASWDKNSQSTTIWHRDPVQFEQAPNSLASVDPDFLQAISLQALTTSSYAISDIAHTVNADGSLQAAYWLEVGTTLLSSFAGAGGLQPSEGNQGAALVIYQDGNLTRLPYADTAGLNQLVTNQDAYGPTSLAILPGLNGQTDSLVIGGEHGLYKADLDAQGMPAVFSAMNIAGLADGAQSGRAVTGLVYNAHDDVLSVSLLGGGSMLYSRTGNLQPTPSDSLLLQVSNTNVPQTLSESLDKRGNPVEGFFLVEVPDTAFDEQGTTQVEFVIPDADLWRTHLREMTFYLNANSGGPEFNLLQRAGSSITETLTFFDYAQLQMGSFATKATTKQLPTISLDYQLNLLDTNGDVVQTVDASINLLPNGATPSFARYDTAQAAGSLSFQAQFDFGDGVEFQKLPFGFKFALPADLPADTQVFAFEIDDFDGTIELSDGTRLQPSDPDYLTVGVPAQRITSDTDVVSSVHDDKPGIGIQALEQLFDAADMAAFMASEGIAYGSTLDALMPGAFDDGSVIPPFLGIAIQYPDGTIKASTVDTMSLQGNEINLDPSTFDRGVVIDVGYGGIFAAQAPSDDISVAKLGQLDSSFGFVRLDDLFGNIGELAPGDDGYVQAALQRSQQEGLNIGLDQTYGSTQAYAVDGFITGTYYASYITPGYEDAAAALEAIETGQVDDITVALFSFDAANANPQNSATAAAIPFASDVIAFEDMPRAGDMDFNDIVVYYGGLV